VERSSQRAATGHACSRPKNYRCFGLLGRSRRSASVRATVLSVGNVEEFPLLWFAGPVASQPLGPRYGTLGRERGRPPVIAIEAPAAAEVTCGRIGTRTFEIKQPARETGPIAALEDARERSGERAMRRVTSPALMSPCAARSSRRSVARPNPCRISLQPCSSPEQNCRPSQRRVARSSTQRVLVSVPAPRALASGRQQDNPLLASTSHGGHC
jgi:hypothetical protein